LSISLPPRNVCTCVLSAALLWVIFSFFANSRNWTQSFVRLGRRSTAWATPPVLVFLFSTCERSLRVLDASYLSGIFCKIFLPVCSLSFHFLKSIFWRPELFDKNLNSSNFSCFCVLRNLGQSESLRTLCMFSSRSSAVLEFAFRSPSHLQFFLQWRWGLAGPVLVGLRSATEVHACLQCSVVSRLILFANGLFFQYHLWKRLCLSPPNCLYLYLCGKSHDFNWDFIEFPQFGKNNHLSNNESPSPWTWYSTPIIRVFYFSNIFGMWRQAFTM
jgi:hypothetical protein